MSHGTGFALPHKYRVYANVAHFKDSIIQTKLNEFTKKKLNLILNEKWEILRRTRIKWNNVTFYLHLYFNLNSLIKKNKWKRKLYVSLFFLSIVNTAFLKCTHSFASLSWRRSGVFIVNFEHISHLTIVFLLLPLSNKFPARKKILQRTLVSIEFFGACTILNITLNPFKVLQKD